MKKFFRNNGLSLAMLGLFVISVLGQYFVGRPLLRRLYENSLGLALIAMFLLSFAGHIYGGHKEKNLKRLMAPKQEPPGSVAEYLKSSEFCFQSFQNWQSEFLSSGALIVFSIFLRQKDSSQSKEVDAPHSLTEE